MSDAPRPSFRRRKTDSSPTALQLVEESVHLARGSEPGDLAWYYAGAVPWVLGLLGYWAHISWFYPEGGKLAWMSLGLVLLFAWLKTCQAVYSWRLLARRRSAPVPVVPLRSLPSLMFRQVRLHASSFVVLPVAAVLSFPLGFVYGYYQHLSASSGPEEQGSGDAWMLARLWPMQSHIALLLISVFSLTVWINILVCFGALPSLLNSLLGLDNLFGLGGWSMMNTTFLLASVLAGWLVVDPLVKSYHVLRCFHGRAVCGGEDLMEVFLAAKVGRAAKSLALAAFFCALCIPSSWSSEPASDPLSGEVATLPAPGASTRVDAPDVSEAEAWTTPEGQRVRQSIREALDEGDYAWRLRMPKDKAAKEADNAFVGFVKAGWEILREIVQSISDAFNRFGKWLRKLVGADERQSPERNEVSGSRGTVWLEICLYALCAILLGLLVYLVVVVVRQARRNATRRLHASPLALREEAPDLADEAVHAAQLPSDGWLSLAREKLAAGDWRLACRALFLAQLARLSEQGFLNLARHKTNLDYELELRRRQPHRVDLQEYLGQRRRRFDAAWYGREVPGEQELRAWLHDFDARGGAA